MNAEPLEREPTERLAAELLAAVGNHYRRRPATRATAQEVLNASAAVVALIFHAAAEVGDEIGAREFFDLALEQQVAELRSGGPVRLRVD